LSFIDKLKYFTNFAYILIKKLAIFLIDNKEFHIYIAIATRELEYSGLAAVVN